MKQRKQQGNLKRENLKQEDCISEKYITCI